MWNDSEQKLKDFDKVPTNSRWLMSEKLENAYKKFPFNIRRHLSSAAFKATQMYEIKPDNKWQKHMNSDAQKYDDKRKLNQKSKYEKDNLPENGMKD